jgi:hypothetical protein
MGNGKGGGVLARRVSGLWVVDRAPRKIAAGVALGSRLQSCYFQRALLEIWTIAMAEDSKYRLEWDSHPDLIEQDVDSIMQFLVVI